MTQPDLSADTVIIRPDNVLVAETDGMTVLMSMDTGAFLELNETGGAIWAALDADQTLAQVQQSLMQTYDVSQAQCQEEVYAFVTDLLTRNLAQKA